MTYSVIEVQKNVYKNLLSKEVINVVTRYVVKNNETGALSWDCFTRERAEQFCEALAIDEKNGNREEERRLSQIPE